MNSIFNGPAAANYDIDLGALPVTDWFYQTVWQAGATANANLQNGGGPPPTPGTILINGTNGVNGGQFATLNFTSGKAHRLRLVNTAVDAAIRVSIDGHQMQVITSDFVPIHPIVTDSVLLGNVSQAPTQPLTENTHESSLCG